MLMLTSFRQYSQSWVNRTYRGNRYQKGFPRQRPWTEVTGQSVVYCKECRVLQDDSGDQSGERAVLCQMWLQQVGQHHEPVLRRAQGTLLSGISPIKHHFQ